MACCTKYPKPNAMSCPKPVAKRQPLGAGPIRANGVGIMEEKKQRRQIEAFLMRRITGHAELRHRAREHTSVAFGWSSAGWQDRKTNHPPDGSGTVEEHF